MILNGALDPNRSILEQNISKAVGFDEALEAFLADYAKQDGCPVPASRQEASAAIIALFTTAANNPIPLTNKS